MAEPEVIDLTDSPTLQNKTVTQETTPTPLFAAHETVEQDNNKKKLRKRKRKKTGNSGTQSQIATAANTRSNSEERDDEDGEQQQQQQQPEERPQSSRQVRRKRENDIREKEDRSASHRIPATGQQTEAAPLPEPTPNGNGNVTSGDLFFMDLTPAPLPPAIGNIPPPTFDVIAPPSKDADEQKLLLPAHVSVLGPTPVEILPPTESDEGDTDYIKYLDYDGDNRRVSFNFFDFDVTLLNAKLLFYVLGIPSVLPRT